MTGRRENRPSRAVLEASATEIRKHIVAMVGRNGQGYLQQGLGAADLFTILYFSELRLDENNPSWPDRDRLFLSTAHNSAAFYATLAERGLIEKSRLGSYCDDGSELEINVSERVGQLVEATCGSLGQGLSVATGMAQAAKRQGRGFRSYVVLGDGELQEGQVWEAAMYAASQQLDNLCLIIDINGLQVEGRTDSVLTMEPMADKWRAFGWKVHDVDGHDFDALGAALEEARTGVGKPSVLLARTVVGKGVPFLEGKMSHNMVFPAETAARARTILEMAHD